MSAEAWHAWRQDVFGDPYLVWHEGPDYQRLLKLSESDVDGVERMLAAGLAAQDPLAAQSIAVLDDHGLAPRSAETLLRGAVSTATEAFLVRVAQALRTLTHDESWAEPIASVLRSQAHWNVRMKAAMVLLDFAPTPRLIQVLGEAMCDQEYLVRYHAMNTLLRYAKEAQRPEIYEGISSSVGLVDWQAAATLLTTRALNLR